MGNISGVPDGGFSPPIPPVDAVSEELAIQGNASNAGEGTRVKAGHSGRAPGLSPLEMMSRMAAAPKTKPSREKPGTAQSKKKGSSEDGLEEVESCSEKEEQGQGSKQQQEKKQKGKQKGKWLQL